jgi:hypothetical protein
MQMQQPIITMKEEGLYAAYAPALGIVAWGGCSDEAQNNLWSDALEMDHSAAQ